MLFQITAEHIRSGAVCRLLEVCFRHNPVLEMFRMTITQVFSHSHTSVMGFFIGHKVTGLSFLVYGFAWAIKHPLRFLGQKSNYSLQIEKFMHWFELVEWGGMAIVGFLGAVLEQCVPGGPFFNLYNETTHQWAALNVWQHSTMYMFFAMAGVVGFLTRCKFQIPVGLDHFMFSLALFNENLLIYTHANRMSALDKYSHHILLIPICSGAVCSLLEVWHRNNPILELFRTSMFITQGTWFWQLAFILFGPSRWDQSDPEIYVFTTLCYSWHYGSVMIFLAFTYGIIYWVLWMLNRRRGNGGEAMEIQKFNQADAKSYTALLNGSDEE